MGKFMSNRNNLENIDEIIDNYNKSMDHLKSEFKILNRKLIIDFNKTNNQLQNDNNNLIKSTEASFSEDLKNLDSKKKIFDEIMPLTEEKKKFLRKKAFYQKKKKKKKKKKKS